jgi:hypothetical protein
MTEPWQSPSSIAQIQTMARSLRHWTGRDLITGTPAPSPADGSGPSLAELVFRAPFVLVSHGLGPDPVLNYGNQTALTLWEMSWDELTRTPSRLTAEAPNREERARLLKAVTEQGYIDDYCGIRISRTGRRFRILQATVWNLLNPSGRYAGQAARFDQWEFI